MSVRTKAIIALVAFIFGIGFLIFQQLYMAGVLFLLTAGLYFSAKRQRDQQD
jgi:hypothetical protein